jgi:undecaprenyl-diphosphatase
MTPLLLAVVAAIVLVGVVLGVELRDPNASPLDTERAEQWFVRHAPGPLRRLLRAADRRIAGGALVALLFGILLVTALAVGWVLDTADEQSGFARWDESAAEWGAAHHTDTSTKLLELVTQLGASGWLVLLMGVVGVVSWIRSRRPAVLGYLAIVGVGVSSLNNALKHLIDRERPAVTQLTEFSSSSFPSGHTAAAAASWAAVALVLARRRRRTGRALAAVSALVITIAVAFSRVLLGVHWLTDVIAGALVGWVWFTIVTILFGGRLLRFGEPVERVSATTGAGPDTTGAAAPAHLSSDHSEAQPPKRQPKESTCHTS